MGLLLAVTLLPSCGSFHQTPDSGTEGQGTLSLDAETASRFARLALKGIQREYPNKPLAVIPKSYIWTA